MQDAAATFCCAANRAICSARYPAEITKRRIPCARQYRSTHSRNGRPATGISGFGMSGYSARMRVPNPPASRIAVLSVSAIADLRQHELADGSARLRNRRETRDFFDRNFVVDRRTAGVHRYRVAHQVENLRKPDQPAPAKVENFVRRVDVQHDLRGAVGRQKLE